MKEVASGSEEWRSSEVSQSSIPQKKKRKKRREKVSTLKEVYENFIYNLSKQFPDFIKHHMHFVNNRIF